MNNIEQYIDKGINILKENNYKIDGLKKINTFKTKFERVKYLCNLMKELYDIHSNIIKNNANDPGGKAIKSINSLSICLELKATNNNLVDCMEKQKENENDIESLIAEAERIMNAS